MFSRSFFVSQFQILAQQRSINPGPVNFHHRVAISSGVHARPNLPDSHLRVNLRASNPQHSAKPAAAVIRLRAVAANEDKSVTPIAIKRAAMFAVVRWPLYPAGPFGVDSPGFCRSKYCSSVKPSVSVSAISGVCRFESQHGRKMLRLARPDTNYFAPVRKSSSVRRPRLECVRVTGNGRR